MATVAQTLFWARRLRTLKQPDWSDYDLVVFLSKVLREKESICAEYVSGRREPERQKQLQLGKLIANHEKRQRRSIMKAVQAFDDTAPVQQIPRGVYDAPFPPPDYRGLYMVAHDGTLLVEIRVHKRAQERDLVPGFRAWLERVEDRERLEKQGLELIPRDGDAKVS